MNKIILNCFVQLLPWAGPLKQETQSEWTPTSDAKKRRQAFFSCSEMYMTCQTLAHIILARKSKNLALRHIWCEYLEGLTANFWVVFLMALGKLDESFFENCVGLFYFHFIFLMRKNIGLLNLLCISPFKRISDKVATTHNPLLIQCAHLVCPGNSVYSSYRG